MDGWMVFDPLVVIATPRWPPLWLFFSCLRCQGWYRGLHWPVLIGHLHEPPVSQPRTPHYCSLYLGVALAKDNAKRDFLMCLPCLWNLPELTFQIYLFFFTYSPNEANLTISTKAGPLWGSPLPVTATTPVHGLSEDAHSKCRSEWQPSIGARSMGSHLDSLTHQQGNFWWIMWSFTYKQGLQHPVSLGRWNERWEDTKGLNKWKTLLGKHPAQRPSRANSWQPYYGLYCRSVWPLWPPPHLGCSKPFLMNWLLADSLFSPACTSEGKNWF